MISRFLLPLLLLAGAAAPFSVLNRRVQLFNRGGQMIQWEPRTVINSIDYPCPSEDFFPDPRNCSRFYQCVQFEVQGIIHSRYLFECLGGKIFDKDAKVCVEGSCEPDVTEAPVPDTTTAPAEPDDTTAAETDAPVSDTTQEPDSTSDPGDATTAEPEPTTPAEEPTTEPDSGGVTEPDDSTTTASPAEDELIEHTPGGRLCKSGRYIQHEKHCNFFQLCGEPNYYYACVAGTGFNEDFQMCRIAAQDESLCAGRPPLDMEITSASLLRQAFDWEEIGVLPDFDGSVFNAYPFVFTNIGVPRIETTIYSADPIPTGERPLIPRDEEETDDEETEPEEDEESGSKRKPEEEVEEEEEEEEETVGESDGERRREAERVRDSEIDILGLPDGTASSALKSLYDKYHRNTKDRNRRTKPQIEQVRPKPLRVEIPPSELAQTPSVKYTNDIENQDDYQIIGALPDSPYNLISPFDYGLADISELQDESIRQVAESPFIIPVLDSQARTPYIDPSSYLIPFGRQIPSPQLYGQAPSYRFPQLNPYTSGLSPVAFSAAPSTSQALQFASPYGIIFSPFAPQVQPSTPYSPLNLFRNALSQSSQKGYFPQPAQYGISSLPFAGSVGSGYTPSYNPYSLLSLDNRDLANLIQLSQSSIAKPTESQSLQQLQQLQQLQPLQQLQVKSPSMFDASSVAIPFNPLSQVFPPIYGITPTATPTDISNLPSFEARTSEGDVFEFTPVSDDTVLALASQGLLNDKTIVGPDFSLDDLEDLDEGDVVLASIPVYKK